MSNRLPSRRREAPVQVRGVVQQIQQRPSHRELVLCADDGRVLRGRVPARLREVAAELVGRRVAFQAYVDARGRYSHPSKAVLLTGFMRLTLTSVRAVRFTRPGAAAEIVVDAHTQEAGDAVLVMPLAVARKLYAGLVEPAMLPTPSGRAR